MTFKNRIWVEIVRSSTSDPKKIEIIEKLLYHGRSNNYNGVLLSAAIKYAKLKGIRRELAIYEGDGYVLIQGWITHFKCYNTEQIIDAIKYFEEINHG